MGIRIWNKKTQRWELQTSLHATSISVRDTAGNFTGETKTVESCLAETQNQINTIKKDIKYIYENGTIGGGGGGGGGAFPKIELKSEANIIVKTENQFTISYFFNSPNSGDGVANYVISKKGSLEAPLVDVKKTIKQGRNSYTFSPIPSGEYELTISVVDSQGIGSNIIVISIVCGALELTTNDALNQDVNLSQDLSVTYTLTSIFKEDATVEIDYPDGRHVVETKKPGTYTIQIGRLESLGVKRLNIKATCGDVESNVLRFNFIVTDTSNMFITTNFEGGEFRTDETVNINFRVSLIGARKFLADIYVNSQLRESDVSCNAGHNFYALQGLSVGTYNVKIKVRTLESENPIRGEIDIPEFRVIDSVLRSYEFVKDKLVVSLDARKGKNNSQSPELREVWEDTERDVPTRTRLHDFAFNHLNGWIPKSDEDQTVDCLTFSGKSYAEIDLQPLNQALTNGLTIEIRHKSVDTGNKIPGRYNAIFDCFAGEKQSGKGLFLDVKEAFARTSYADSVNSEYYNGDWLTHTFVVNPIQQELIIYTNGCIASYTKMDKASDMLVAQKIILGARRNDDGDIIDNSNCKIQTVRIYDRVLNDEEVFKNYVSDLPLEEQDHLISIHEGQNQIPILKLKFDESALGTASSTTPVDIEYSDPSDPSKNLILYNSIIKKQGTTSLTYPVSNYTIQLYDSGMPYDYSPKDDWIPENIFTLKADYMDSSHANNTGIAAYTSEVFKRLGIKNPAQKKDDRVKNTIDGFMVTLYINGVNRGLYNFNTDRYGHKNYGLSNLKFKTTAVSYEAAANTGLATGFHTTDWDKIKGAFKVRYFKGETDENKYMTYDPETQTMVMTQGTHREFERLIQWINSAGNDPNNIFYSEFKEHIDLDHALIYMLTVEIFGLMDNLEKNMVLTYFGEQYNGQTGAVEEIWYPQLYDLDSSVGLSNNGELKYQPCVNFTQEPGMPADHQYNGTSSLLWSCIKKHFFKELKTMYSRLRRTGILNVETLMEYYQGKTIDKVSPYLYSLDSRLKYIEPSAGGVEKDTYYHFCKGRRIEFTKKWISKRITFLDSIYEYGNENNPDGNYWKYLQARYLKKNDYDTNFTIRVKTTTPLFLTTVDDSMNPHGKKYFVSDDKEYSIEVPINNATDGAMFGITFGPEIRDLQFPDNIRLTSLYLEHGKSIVELNIPNNRDLTSIVLDQCDSLQYFNVSRCTKLGSNVGSEKIKFDNCPNIRDIDISSTSISGFTVNPKGGIIENLVCNGSKIETFILKNQPYVDALNIQDCTNLKKFELSNCSSINQVIIPRSAIETFRILDCSNINTIQISDTAKLNSLTDVVDEEKRPNFLIDNCPKLIKIVMSGLTNKDMTFLDLINIENIQYLDIRKCSYLSEIRFSEACRSLTTLLCTNSAIKNFKFGRAGQTVDYLDFQNFPDMNSVNFKECFNVKSIINCNFGKSSPMSADQTFYNCQNLERIQGYLRLNGNAHYTFYNCKKLSSLPTNLDLSGITSTDNTFNTTKINFNEAKRILNLMTNVVTLKSTFANCSNIVTSSLPDTLFNKNPKVTSISNIFSGCSGITGTFPVRIYDHVPKLTVLSLPFGGCQMEMPVFDSETILRSLTELRTANWIFGGITVTRMPNKDLLKNCTKLVNIDELFRECTSMSKSIEAGEYFIEEDYFANNPLITGLDRTFLNCRSLSGKIPPNLFRNQTKIIDLYNAFAGCSGLTGEIPEDLFPYSMINEIKTSYITNVNGLFSGCSGLIGNIPNSLFEFHRNLSEMVDVFNGCTKLGSEIAEELKKFPTRLFKNKPNLKNIRNCFYKCHNLKIMMDKDDEEYKNLFSDNPLLAYIDNLFYECSNMHGSIPSELFAKKDERGRFLPSKIVSAKNVFAGCSNVSGNIPKDIFKSFYYIEDLSGFFSGCSRFRGGIPYDLLYNCTKLKKADNLFYIHQSVFGELGMDRNYELDHCLDEDLGIVYFIHKDFFTYNPKLESINGIFNHCSIKGEIPSTLFANNPELKFLNNAFYSTNINVNLDSSLFGRNPKITSLYETFAGCSGNIVISSDFIRADIHNYIHRDSNGKVIEKNFGATFANNKMTGTAPELWNMYPSANTAGPYTSKTFTGTNIDNIDDVPLNWK